MQEGENEEVFLSLSYRGGHKDVEATRTSSPTSVVGQAWPLAQALVNNKTSPKGDGLENFTRPFERHVFYGRTGSRYGRRALCYEMVYSDGTTRVVSM